MDKRGSKDCHVTIFTFIIFSFLVLLIYTFEPARLTDKRLCSLGMWIPGCNKTFEHEGRIDEPSTRITLTNHMCKPLLINVKIIVLKY